MAILFAGATSPVMGWGLAGVAGLKLSTALRAVAKRGRLGVNR